VSDPVVVLTPNLCGRDGISRLARLVTDAFDEPIPAEDGADRD